MIPWLKQLLASPREQKPKPVRSVPGALVVSGNGGEVIYNLLTPHMQQFMGRCVGALKKAGISARGTAQFSLLVGERGEELMLDHHYRPEDDPGAVARVVEAARALVSR